ncbi:hypothetical protein E4413_02815 [Leptospira interrogans]|nr:hypothetical protein E4412_15845 [Leptospira interrogans]QCO39986.1 hypothetical protein E4413_02815 [Leptospira interrogans]
MRVPTNLVTLRILNTHNSNLVFVRIPTIYNFKKIQNKNIKTFTNYTNPELIILINVNRT